MCKEPNFIHWLNFEFNSIQFGTLNGGFYLVDYYCDVKNFLVWCKVKSGFDFFCNFFLWHKMCWHYETSTLVFWFLVGGYNGRRLHSFHMYKDIYNIDVFVVLFLCGRFYTPQNDPNSITFLFNMHCTSYRLFTYIIE